MECPTCKGEKRSLAHLNTGLDSSKHRWEVIDCMTCQGTGQITPEHAKRIEEGKALRAKRLKSGELLYEAAARMGITPAQLSAMEQGRIPARKK